MILEKINLKKYLLIILCSCGLVAQAQNNPYVDDKLVHFGFSLGLNMMTFGVTDSEQPIMMGGQTDTLHARVSNLLPGFSVGFITDLRLSRHLNLRLCPGLSFSQRSLTYKAISGREIHSGDGQHGDVISLLSIPITIPLYLKWSAERERNYRPYLIGGGGFEYNVYRDTEQPVLLKGPDYFVEVGFGCDFYFQWFKFCPQITYRIGFANQLTPTDENPHLLPDNAFYTDVISRLMSHMLCLTFNFE